MTSSKAVTVVFSVVALGLGFSLGKSQANVEVVEVEKIRSVPINAATTTVTVTEPTPEICSTIPGLAATLLEGDKEQSDAVGEISRALDDLARDAYSQDIAAINASIEVVNENKDVLDASTVTRAQAHAALQVAIEQCEREVKP